MILKLHRACKVIGFTQKEMPNEWPRVFSLEHIAKLQFPENASDESIFFRALKDACTGGSLKHLATIELRQYKLSASVQRHITELIQHELRDNSYEVTVHYVDHRDLAAWLEKQDEEPSAHLAAWFKATTSDTPAPPKGAAGASGGMVELDYSVLATPAALLDAFEKWGMKAAWFDELDSHKWLLDARRQKGQGQRGHVILPMFCPYAVMCGLVDKVRKATRLKPDTAWRTLEHKFPKVHAAFESHDTRDRTGD